uniref:Uncharacterized protein n=1 Tax=Oryza brachyantha TaxID=4533 RepID=J3MKC3_ORYBR
MTASYLKQYLYMRDIIASPWANDLSGPLPRRDLNEGPITNPDRKRQAKNAPLLDKFGQPLPSPDNLPNNGPTYYYYCLSQQLLPHLVGVHGAAVRADHRDCYPRRPWLPSRRRARSSYPRRPWLPSLAIVATARAICADPLYVHALDYFTGNNRVRDAITAKLVGYLARAEEIRQALVGDDVARVAAVAAPTAELKKDSKGNDGGGGGDSERANLRAGLHSAIVSGKPDVRWSDVFGLDGAKQVP